MQYAVRALIHFGRAVCYVFRDFLNIAKRLVLKQHAPAVIYACLGDNVHDKRKVNIQRTAKYVSYGTSLYYLLHFYIMGMRIMQQVKLRA